MADPSVALFGPLDSLLAPYIEYILVVLAVSNFLTRKMSADRHAEQAQRGGAEAISQHPVHAFTMGGLVLATFYYTTLHHHSGIVLSALVVGLFITDFFELESRRVEARQEMALEQPKAAIVASLLVFLYAAYLGLFFLIQPFWNSLI